MLPGFVVLDQTFDSASFRDSEGHSILSPPMYDHHTFINPGAGTQPFPYSIQDCLMRSWCYNAAPALGSGLFDGDVEVTEYITGFQSMAHEYNLIIDSSLSVS